MYTRLNQISLIKNPQLAYCMGALPTSTHSQTGNLMEVTYHKSVLVFLGSNPGSASYSCVTLARSLNLSVSQILNVDIVGNNSKV